MKQNTGKQSEMYKMIPIIIFCSILMILGILLSNTWRKQREERIQDQAANTTQYASYTISFNNLPNKSDYSYKLISVKDSKETILVEFKVKDEKTLTNTANGNNLTNVTVSDIDNTAKLILKLVLSDNKSIDLMEGKFDKNKTIFETTYNYNFSESEAFFQLTTPTTLSNKDENQGIHFFNTENEPSLKFPILNGDWVYEAKLTNKNSNETYIIGDFQDPTKSDDTFQYSKNENNLTFPGEDFTCIEKLLGDNPSKCTGLDINNGSYTMNLYLTAKDNKNVEVIKLFELDILASYQAHKMIEMKRIYKQPYFEITKRN